MYNRIVKVQLGDSSKIMSSKCYDFWTNLELKENDYVVCDTCNGLVLGRVVDYAVPTMKVTKWVVCKVDLTEHNRRVAVMTELKELRRQMDIRRHRVEEMQIYEILAQQDAQLASMLNRYKELMTQ